MVGGEGRTELHRRQFGEGGDEREAGSGGGEAEHRDGQEDLAGLDVPTAVDIYAALCNIDVYTTLRTERLWSPDRIEHWWGEALARELLSRPAGAP
ncbi:hypothetical protein Ssi02_45540 [Sinosporangium siamense]|uniref:Uncharacterized protein n=1 Tax=Sinosporangium siamense TaxID=1367973 RepID=A0A919V8C9_9ACTN|nr:hypothetical protein Ssi02_45540 [Sinosporangium siamense]